jgi:hypothetical protein
MAASGVLEREMALALRATGESEQADARFRELDLRWEADIDHIPDRAASEELLRRCKEVYLGFNRDAMGN